MIAIQRPYAFLFLLLLIPIGVFNFYRIRQLTRTLKSSSVPGRNLVLRTILRLAACVFVILGFAGISWGSRTFPVQKSGDAVCFVFDISYSMMAEDAPGGLTRLEASKQYAYNLLGRMEGTSVSVILAKGDGVIAVPLTDDVAAVESMLESLSPSLMTSSGSSLGKGISAAIQSFPGNMAQASHIWVFTDGDETDNGLSGALDDAARFGFPVTLVGFGTAKPVEVTAGDGKTKVKTWLHADKMIDAAAASSKKAIMPHRKANAYADAITYVAADSEGSGWFLLKQLSDKTSSGESYDMRSVPRHGVFLLLALLSLIASYFVSEFDPHFLNGKTSSILMIMMVSTIFSGCKSGKATVLSGTFFWYQEKYQNATGSFLRVYTDAQKSRNEKLSQYASYDLAATYIMQEEYEAALSRLETIPPDADSKLKSAAFYNLGIIANRQGNFEAAQDFFKKAIIEDDSNIDAKINLEFTHQQAESRQTKSAEKEMTAVNQEKNDNSMANAIYTLIQQEEQERWKKLQSNKKDSSTLDY